MKLTRLAVLSTVLQLYTVAHSYDIPLTGEKHHWLQNFDLNVTQHHKRRHHRVRSATSVVENGAECLHSNDSTICNRTEGGVCRNKTCVSACSDRHMQKCTCPLEDDNYCYLCCGNSRHTCRPAHEHHIFKPNGEYWERDTCARCRNHYKGLSCDDRDRRRVCFNNRCASTICQGQPEGSFCDMRRTKICADGECRDRCKEHRRDLLTCDCDVYSEDRCQLCCYDSFTKRCENAFRKYGIASKDYRPIYRHGLDCKHGSMCNRFGTCGATASSNSWCTVLIVLLMLLPYTVQWASS